MPLAGFVVNKNTGLSVHISSVQISFEAEIIYRGIGNASRAQYFGWAVHIIPPTPCDSHLLGRRKKVGEEGKEGYLVTRTRFVKGIEFVQA